MPKFFERYIEFLGMFLLLYFLPKNWKVPNKILYKLSDTIQKTYEIFLAWFFLGIEGATNEEQHLLEHV